MCNPTRTALLAVLLQSDSYAQWVPQASGVTVQLKDAVMLDSSAAIVVGASRSILKTVDAGPAWDLKESGTTNGGETWIDTVVAGKYVSAAYGGHPAWPAIFMASDAGRIRSSCDLGLT